MYKYIFFLLIIGVGSIVTTEATPVVRKQNLKVLYVGNRPDLPLPDYYTTQLEAANFADYKGRMAAFETMLKEYFTTVKTIDGRDYSEKLSDEYDVTIFDALPKPIVRPVVERDSVFGFATKIQRGKFLSDDFDRPAIFVSHMSDEIGHQLGLKLDWYCLCLFYHALNVRTEHPIFHQPFDVKITFENRPTPDDFYLYSQDWVLPRDIPMWRVDRDSSRIGMVSGWYGVEEGGDAEIISGGHCMKSYENMAIGRHGNFMLWGFAAAPDRMTKEAQTVFANAVCYISHFSGKKPVVRKFNYPTLRTKIQDFLTVLTPEGYQTYLKGVNTYNQWLEKKQKEIQQIKDRPLRKEEQDYLDREPKTPWSHIKYVEKNSSFGLIFDFNMDIEATRKYLVENMEYFYSGHEVKGEFIVDEEVKSLGISNRSVRLLEECVNMLETNREPEKAARILNRYTNQRFNTAVEWRKWLDTYRDKLFFSELGDYKFMGDGSECKDYSYLYEEEKTRPVVVSMEQTGEGAERNISVTIKIEKGYHIYASGGKDCPFIMTKIALTLPEGVEKIGEWQLPVCEKYAGEEGVSIYQGNVVFVQKVKIKDAKVSDRKIQCEVEYQCCDLEMCMPPEKEIHQVKL
ncbi:MAG: protein-disulfide reductase DsbD family protein [Odoribacter sp.]